METKPKVRKTPRKPSKDRVRRWCLAYAERFAATREGMRSVMLRRAVRAARFHVGTNMAEVEAWIDEVIDELIRLGVVNDAAFAAARTGSLSRSGRSSRVIRQKLVQKGVEAEMADEAIVAFDERARGDDDDPIDPELARAAALMRRRRLGPYGTKKSLDDRKALATLARAGFSFAASKTALALSPDEADDLSRRLQ
jgi:regulatory protein